MSVLIGDFMDSNPEEKKWSTISIGILIVGRQLKSICMYMLSIRKLKIWTNWFTVKLWVLVISLEVILEATLVLYALQY